jgi:hypothetical protein
MARNFLNKIKLKCGNKCELKIQYENYFHHIIQECVNAQVKCGACLTIIQNSLFNNHIEKCDYVLEECNFCKVLIKRKDYTNHFNECPEKSIECKKCKKQIKNKDSYLHDEQCIQILCPCCKDLFLIDLIPEKGKLLKQENKEKILQSNLKIFEEQNDMYKLQIRNLEMKINETSKIF